MRRNAVEIASSRLRIARDAVTDLECATTYDAFADAWFVFLTSWKGIYTVLEQGAKSSPQSMQWFGAKASERRNDPLLQYLFQARNHEEHGLERSVEMLAGSRLYAVTGGQTITVEATSGEVRAVDADTGTPLELVYEQPAGPTLTIVTDRGNRKYGRPIAHKGQMLDDMSPIGVARVAITYISGLVDEAEQLGSTSP